MKQYQLMSLLFHYLISQRLRHFYKDIFISKVMSGLAKLNIVKSFDNNVAC